MPSGSFGPTTAGRMDSYVDLFQANGGSMVMLAKGNRSKQVVDACKKHKGFYLGSIGGPAPLPPQKCLRKGGGAGNTPIRLGAGLGTEGEEFPALILPHHKGNE